METIANVETGGSMRPRYANIFLVLLFTFI